MARETTLGPLMAAIAILAGGYFFWFGIVSLFAAWEKPEYSHGYIIPLVAGFILLKRLPESGGLPSTRGSWTGLILVVLGLLVGSGGSLASVPDIVTYGMLVAIFGLILLAAGTSNGLKLWPAWVYLGFMLPLPNFIYWPLSIKLQFISSELGVLMIKLMNVPVLLEGNIIDLGNYQLQVAEACSGLRYLFPLASFGFLFATLYRGPVWHKSIIFLSSIPITIGMNSLRIAIIGFLVNSYGIEQAEGFLHFFEGWVIFAACIVLLFLLAILLQRLTRNPQPISQVLDLDTRGLVAKLARFGRIGNTLPLTIAAGLIAIAAVGTTVASGQSVYYPERQRFTSFPMTIGEWRGRSSYLDFQVEKVLAADDYLMADYVTGDGGELVNLLIAYYRALNEGSGIHSPEVCIPAGGWEVSRWQQSTLPLKVSGWENLNVNRAIIQRGVDRQLVYYWFEQRGNRMTNDYVFKAMTVWGSVTSGRSDGALIRVVSPIQGNDVAAAERRLQKFLNETVGDLQGFVPP